MSDAAIALEFQVTDDQVEIVNRQGWVVLRQVFSAAEQERFFPLLRSYVNGVQTRAINQDAVPFGPTAAQPAALGVGQSDPYSQDSGKTAFNLLDAPPDVARIIKHPRLGEIAARLLGVAGVRVMHFSGLFKPSGGAGTPLHQDLTYLPLDSDRSVALWIPLTDIEADMGPLIFASGSHAVGAIDDPASARGRFKFMQTGPMKAGDISVHLGWTIHGSLKNASGRQREAFGISYYADGARIRPHEDVKFMQTLMGSCFAGLKPGDLAGGPLNPVVFPPQSAT
jgi:ectoine hydroxylase-related dioxygenase (phytanoyl-CoA dioxygenase family)